MFRLNKIEYYFITEIEEREVMSKRLNKYIAIFYYIDKILIVLSETKEGISIISFSNIIGTLAGIASASSSLVFSFTAGIIKKLLTHFRPMFHWCINQVGGFYYHDIWKVLVEEWHFASKKQPPGLFINEVLVTNWLKIAKNKKKKHNEIVKLAKRKLNSVKTLISQAF